MSNESAHQGRPHHDAHVGNGHPTRIRIPLGTPNASQYVAERRALSDIFPRGRFRRTVDGACVLRSINRTWAGDEVYVQKLGEVVGIAYQGSPKRYLNRLGNLVLRHQAGDGEGLIHVPWTPEVARRLPKFSLGTPTHRPKTGPPRREGGRA